MLFVCTVVRLFDLLPITSLYLNTNSCTVRAEGLPAEPCCASYCGQTPVGVWAVWDPPSWLPLCPLPDHPQGTGQVWLNLRVSFPIILICLKLLLFNIELWGIFPFPFLLKLHQLDLFIFEICIVFLNMTHIFYKIFFDFLVKICFYLTKNKTLLNYMITLKTSTLFLI